MAPATRQVALFGGSFNPPHVGHLLAAAYVRAVAPVDVVLLMPAFLHPFGKKLAPFEDRLALCAALASQLSGVEVTDVESRVADGGRTIRTVEYLRSEYPHDRYSLVVGADIVSEWHRWFEFERLATLARPIVIGRMGYTPTAPTTGPLAGALFLWDVPMPAVSSTDVRNRLAKGSPVEHLVPRAVLHEVRARGLYGTGAGRPEGT
jgi:nicotinate-nucleotide adenylyltransferase